MTLQCGHDHSRHRNQNYSARLTVQASAQQQTSSRALLPASAVDDRPRRTASHRGTLSMYLSISFVSTKDNIGWTPKDATVGLFLLNRLTLNLLSSLCLGLSFCFCEWVSLSLSCARASLPTLLLYSFSNLPVPRPDV